MSAADRFCRLAGGMELCYRTDGQDTGRPLLLLAGLGLDLTSWPALLLDGLVEEGFRVIRFDNRDAGRSSHIDTPPPSKLRQLHGRSLPEDYDLADMAADALGLMDALEVERADLVGMSMGGMIAQILAARHPARVRTLTSIFSTTGSGRVGQPARSTLVRMARRPARTPDAFAERHLSTLRHIGSTVYPYDERAERAWAQEAWARGRGLSRAEGAARQIAAIRKSGDRTEEVRRIATPTLVIHGDRDRMVHPSGGEATAAAIPEARHVVIPGMRHHIAPGVVPQLLELIGEHTSIADAAGPSN